MQSTIQRYTFTVKEHHLDTFGHVNNAVYLELFEEARWEIIANRGFGIAEIKKLKKGPVILEVSVRYSREILLRQQITIQTQVTSYKGKICLLKQTMENEKSELCCEAEYKMGFFDLERRKLIEPSQQWLAALGINNLN